MELDIAITDEYREIIQIINDPLSGIFQVLTDSDLDGSVCLRFIDRYGDTTFNPLQMPILLKKWSHSVIMQKGRPVIFSGQYHDDRKLS